MPPIEELKNPNDKFATVLYTSDGKEMGRYYRNSGNRVYADYNEISQHVIDALIATEDSRFLDHSGIDMRAFMRVFVKTLVMQQKNAGGGSTITQQLAKQLYSPTTHNLLDRALQKPIEWMIAVKLERYYSKDEIIKMYLNQFDFLYNAVGIKSAAHVYFGKNANELNIEEAATLVGMVKNPAYYNPVRHNERTRQRRNTVFEQMEKQGDAHCSPGRFAQAASAHPEVPPRGPQGGFGAIFPRRAAPHPFGQETCALRLPLMGHAEICRRLDCVGGESAVRMD